MNNIFVLSYDGCLTGSQNLRNYNKNVTSKQYQLNNNPIAQYCNNYDNLTGGKNNEPHYDAYLASIATMKNNSENISYYPMIYDDNKYYLRTGVKEYEYYSRHELFGYEYENAWHVFILAPFSKLTIKYINNLLMKFLQQQYNTQNKILIFHVQGEALNSIDNTNYIDCCTLSEKTTGMKKKKVNLFEEAFNLHSGNIQARIFRQLMNDVGAKLYSAHITDNIKNKLYLSDEEIPLIYKNMTNDIINVINNYPYKPTPEIFDLKYSKLNIIGIIQDVTDKDNLSSVGFLSHCNKNQELIDIVINGFRLYSSNSVPFNIAGKMNTFDFSEYGQMRNGDYYKPADKYSNGNVKFLEKETLIFNSYVQQQFVDILNLNKNIFNWYGFDKDSIIDGIEEQSETGLCPFNMSLFWFPPNTYMSRGLDMIGGRKKIVLCLNV